MWDSSWVLTGLTVLSMLTAVGSVILSWKIRNIKDDIREETALNIKDEVERTRAALAAEVEHARAAIAAETANTVEDVKACIGSVETLTHRTGEMGNALREKIREVELFIRDEFVRKETFNLVIDRTLQEIRQIGADLGARQNRMEQKLDGIVQRQADRISGNSS
jgi:hypothetical protein